MSNSKPELTIIPRWLQYVFVVSVSFYFIVGIVLSLLFFKIGFMWVEYLKYVAPVLVGLYLLFFVLDKRKSMLHRLFISLMFFLIVSFISEYIYYFCLYLVRVVFEPRQVDVSNILFILVPYSIYTVVCLALIYIYRKELSKI